MRNSMIDKGAIRDLWTMFRREHNCSVDRMVCAPRTSKRVLAGRARRLRNGRRIHDPLECNEPPEGKGPETRKQTRSATQPTRIGPAPAVNPR
ncbi:MAG: hypothetical protein KatS3mg111_3795 [Pirellulaceae bacterium]|nr:MAG: hypothetical protein KatS3mg111_3795 [Pirellulaceae bacterium]